MRVNLFSITSSVLLLGAAACGGAGTSHGTPHDPISVAGAAGQPATPTAAPSGSTTQSEPSSAQPMATATATTPNPTAGGASTPNVTTMNPPPSAQPATPAKTDPPQTTPPAKPDEKPVDTTPAREAGTIMRGPEPTPESAAKAGPYKVGQITSGFRNGPDFGGATIYYPMDAEPPFAMIVFCPGWLGTQASDAPWAPFMASHGIVFMNIDTNTVGDSVTQRKEAEWDALESLKGEHTREDSPLKGKLDLDRVSLMGWSMGGGGAWLNGKAHPELKALVTLAGHNSTAGGAGPQRGLTVPTLMLAGTADTAILGLGMSQPVYEVIPESTPKMLYEVQGASHFDFNNPAYMDGVPARYALSWQKVYLEGDMRYYKFLLEKGPKASDFRTTLK